VDLNEILVFARVVQTGSFTRAAARLGIPKSTVSRKVSALEERLGSRLLQRTTRKLNVTDAGRVYYDYCLRIVADVEDAERAVSSLQDRPRGLLRVTAPVNCAFLGPIVSAYLKRYPEVQLELLCTERTVDLVEERFDVGIRGGGLADSTLVARSLGRSGHFLVATPAYLKKRGRPRSPEDLKQHDFFFFGAGLDSAILRLQNGDRSAQIVLTPRMIVSDNEILYSVATAGLGVALLPAFLCVADLGAHRLERVLRDWSSPSTPVHVVYPSLRHLSPKVKTFVDHLHEQLTPPPWEIGPYAEPIDGELLGKLVPAACTAK
jgi:DNA-binding transcriptional LysR family regulator